MTDHAVLIPTREGPVGGIVSEPPGSVRASLILLAGYGPPARSGFDSFWTRLARSYAQQGLVVLRVDYCREGETLPIGAGVRGQVPKRDLDQLLLRDVLPWFRAQLVGLDTFLAGSCSGARGAIELAASDPTAIAGIFLIVPHLRVLEGMPLPANDDGAAEAGDPGAVDPKLVECFRVVLDHAPSWILIGENDDPDVPQLTRLLGHTTHSLEVETVPGVALHFLDKPDLQVQAERRLTERITHALDARCSTNTTVRR